MKNRAADLLNSAGRTRSLYAACALALFSLPIHLQAQAVTMYGTLANFDVMNDTGQQAHGFEIEIHGVNSVGGTFSYNRYGPPQIVPFAGGIYVRYMSAWDPATQQFTVSTPVNVTPTATNGHQCVLNSLGYDTSGCEHFGVWTYTTIPGPSIYRWMIADPNNPGQLITSTTQVPIPAPVWSVVPPVVAGNPVDIVAQVDPPVPPPPAKTYGPAQWMKTYKTENRRQVGLDELIADNPVVPQDAAELETPWELMQSQIGEGNSKHKQKRGALGGGSQAVVRRFEFYKYNGAIDPVTGQALCTDPLCLTPADGEVGDFIGAQNGAINLNVPPQYNVNVTVSGDGAVASSDAAIKCPTVSCTESVKPNTSVTLTAKGAKDVFTGWSGACAGTSATCTVVVNSEAPVTATFLTPYKLVMKTNGSGTVKSNPSVSSFVTGSVVTVTATPGSGATWKGWTGSTCSGLSLSCTVTITADTTLTANFR